MKNCNDRVGNYKKNLKTKMIIDFDYSVTCCIKSLAKQKLQMLSLDLDFSI